MKPRIRILLAEDHSHMRQQLRQLLENEEDFAVLGEAADGCEAVALAAKIKPDLLVTDLAMPGLHGLEVARRVLEAQPATRVLIVSVNADEPYIRLALRYGVAGYVCKTACHESLVAAVRAIWAGQRYLSPPLDGALLTAVPATNPTERNLLRLTAHGIGDEEIGRRLGLPKAGIRSLRAELMARLGLSDLNALVEYVGLNFRSAQ